MHQYAPIILDAANPASVTTCSFVAVAPDLKLTRHSLQHSKLQYLIEILFDLKPCRPAKYRISTPCAAYPATVARLKFTNSGEPAVMVSREPVIPAHVGRNVPRHRASITARSVSSRTRSPKSQGVIVFQCTVSRLNYTCR